MNQKWRQVKVLLEDEKRALGFWCVFQGERGCDNVGRMITAVLEAQGKVVLGNLKTLGESESQGNAAYPEEAGPRG